MNFMDKLQKAMPEHVVPYTRQQMSDIHLREAKSASLKCFEQHQLAKVQLVLGNCGIGKKHLKCRFDSYITGNDGQTLAYKTAAKLCKGYLDDYSPRCFVFSGTPGTGKNQPCQCNSQ